MYYRYEACPVQENKFHPMKWDSIFASGALNPYQMRKINQTLKSPKWYKDNTNVPSRCWFTQAGYDKYHILMEEMIAEISSFWKIRIIKCETLNNIVVKGKIQCIELLTKEH